MMSRLDSEAERRIYGPLAPAPDEALWNEKGVLHAMRYAYKQGVLEGIGLLQSAESIDAARKYFLKEYPALRLDDADAIRLCNYNTFEFWTCMMGESARALRKYLEADGDESGE